MSGLTDGIMTAAQIVLGLALLMTLAHLLRARSLLERVVALEILTACTIGGAAILTLVRGENALIDPALAVALVSFTGAVAFASFIERRQSDD